MAYLEQMRLIHRNLAAKNVLVINESSVKISDFGMSVTLKMGSDHYTVSITYHFISSMQEFYVLHHVLTIG